MPGGEERADNRILLALLSAVERDPAVTQRGVASEIGVAVGLINAYVKRCARKGLIKISQAPARRYAYYLTAKGLAEKSRLTAEYLSHSLAFFRRARMQYGDILQRLADMGQRRVILAGAGELAEIVKLIAPSYGVEVAAILDQKSALKTVLSDVGDSLCCIVTSINAPHEMHELAASLLGPDRVYAPPLLRLAIRTAEATRTAGTT